MWSVAPAPPQAAPKKQGAGPNPGELLLRSESENQGLVPAVWLRALSTSVLYLMAAGVTLFSFPPQQGAHPNPTQPQADCTAGARPTLDIPLTGLQGDKAAIRSPLVPPKRNQKGKVHPNPSRLPGTPNSTSVLLFHSKQDAGAQRGIQLRPRTPPSSSEPIQ